MADIGDVSRYALSAPLRKDNAVSADYSDECRMVGFVGLREYASAYSQNVSSTATVTGATTGALVTLLRAGWQVDVQLVVGGSASFYDLQDGTFYAYESGSAKAWSIVVSAAGTSVVVTALSSGGGGTVSYGFTF